MLTLPLRHTTNTRQALHACRDAQQLLPAQWGPHPPHERLQRLVRQWLHPDPQQRGNFRGALQEARVIRDALCAQLQLV